jgi:hypothetical protein
MIRKYIVSVFTTDSEGNEHDAQWYEVEAFNAEDSVQAIIDKVFDGGPLEAGVEVTALPMPDKPIRVERLADMSEFEAEFRETS